jgi:hypothetical protein
MCLTCKHIYKRVDSFDFPEVTVASSFHCLRYPKRIYVTFVAKPGWSKLSVREFKNWIAESGFSRSKFRRSGNIILYGKIRYEEEEVILNLTKF